MPDPKEWGKTVGKALQTIPVWGASEQASWSGSVRQEGSKAALHIPTPTSPVTEKKIAQVCNGTLFVMDPCPSPILCLRLILVCLPQEP